MKPDLPLQRELPDPNGPREVLRRMLPGLVLCAIAAGMSGLAQGQPAWLGGHVGPGLMAQILSLGVLGLGVAWAMLLARARVTPTPSQGCGGDCGAPERGLRHSAPALLGAVLTFALTLPVLGLVLAAGLAAALAAWGAGERSPRALALTVLGLMALVAIVGVALLPATAPLWPVG
jgi:hypothetical protein